MTNVHDKISSVLLDSRLAAWEKLGSVHKIIDATRGHQRVNGLLVLSLVAEYLAGWHELLRYDPYNKDVKSSNDLLDRYGLVSFSNAAKTVLEYIYEYDRANPIGISVNICNNGSSSVSKYRLAEMVFRDDLNSAINIKEYVPEICDQINGIMLNDHLDSHENVCDAFVAQFSLPLD